MELKYSKKIESIEILLEELQKQKNILREKLEDKTINFYENGIDIEYIKLLKQIQIQQIKREIKINIILLCAGRSLIRRNLDYSMQKFSSVINEDSDLSEDERKLKLETYLKLSDIYRRTIVNIDRKILNQPNLEYSNIFDIQNIAISSYVEYYELNIESIDIAYSDKFREHCNNIAIFLDRIKQNTIKFVKKLNENDIIKPKIQGRDVGFIVHSYDAQDKYVKCYLNNISERAEELKFNALLSQLLNKSYCVQPEIIEDQNSLFYITESESKHCIALDEYEEIQNELNTPHKRQLFYQQLIKVYLKSFFLNLQDLKLDNLVYYNYPENDSGTIKIVDFINKDIWDEIAETNNFIQNIHNIFNPGFVLKKTLELDSINENDPNYTIEQQQCRNIFKFCYLNQMCDTYKYSNLIFKQYLSSDDCIQQCSFSLLLKVFSLVQQETLFLQAELLKTENKNSTDYMNKKDALFFLQNSIYAFIDTIKCFIPQKKGVQSCIYAGFIDAMKTISMQKIQEFNSINFQKYSGKLYFNPEEECSMIDIESVARILLEAKLIEFNNNAQILDKTLVTPEGTPNNNLDIDTIAREQLIEAINFSIFNYEEQFFELKEMHFLKQEDIDYMMNELILKDLEEILRNSPLTQFIVEDLQDSFNINTSPKKTLALYLAGLELLNENNKKIIQNNQFTTHQEKQELIEKYNRNKTQRVVFEQLLINNSVIKVEAINKMFEYISLKQINTKENIGTQDSIKSFL